MKIKYSDKIKEQLSISLLKEIVQLSFTVIPYQAVHIFEFENIQTDEICITHKVPIINIEKKIYLSQREIPKEIIILFRCNGVIYLFTESEYTK